MYRLLRLDRLNRIDSMFLHTCSLAHLVLQSTQSGIHFIGIFYHYTRLARNGNNGFFVVSPHFVDRSTSFIVALPCLSTTTGLSHSPPIYLSSSLVDSIQVQFSAVQLQQYSTAHYHNTHNMMKFLLQVSAFFAIALPAVRSAAVRYLLSLLSHSLID
jgi:hypothetical protein